MKLQIKYKVARGSYSAKVVLLELQWVRMCLKATRNCRSDGRRTNRLNVCG